MDRSILNKILTVRNSSFLPRQPICLYIIGGNIQEVFARPSYNVRSSSNVIQRRSDGNEKNIHHQCHDWYRGDSLGSVRCFLREKARRQNGAFSGMAAERIIIPVSLSHRAFRSVYRPTGWWMTFRPTGYAILS